MTALSFKKECRGFEPFRGVNAAT